MTTATLAPPNPHRSKVNRSAGIIHDVKIAGVNSKKGRRYPIRVLQKALPMYENTRINIDHVDPGQRRSYRDRVGQIRNVHLKEDGLYADAHFNKSHELFGQIMDDAEERPTSLGFSHDTRGSSHNEGGTAVVDSIDKVLSCDLVANPATTDSIFESDDDAEQAPDDIPPASAPLAQRLARFFEDRDGAPVPYVEPSEIPLAQRIARFTRTNRYSGNLAEDDLSEPYEPDPATLTQRIARFVAPDRHGLQFAFEFEPSAALVEDTMPESYLPPLDAPLARRMSRFFHAAPMFAAEPAAALSEDELQEGWSPAARRAAELSRAAHRASGFLAHHASPIAYLQASLAHHAAAKAADEAADEIESSLNPTVGQIRTHNILRQQAKYHRMAARNHFAHSEIRADDTDRVTAESVDAITEDDMPPTDAPLATRIARFAR